MRIPKRVNTVLDRAERHAGALLAVIALVAAALAAMWIPLLAGFILGIAFGGFVVHVRMTKRAARSRREIDDLLRENGALRHRNNVLASGVITREAQMTQALVAIPEIEAGIEVNEDPQRTQALPALFDDEADGRSDDGGADTRDDESDDGTRDGGEGGKRGKTWRFKGDDESGGDGTSETADLAEIRHVFRQARAS